MADRLLEMMAPHTVARAADCGWECCGRINSGRWCCYYPSKKSCGSCQTYIYCS
ncbi:MULTISPECIES: hypothetical protein [unclassified Nonomuraea]|uniref:hypothetical protein n=1 Tax=unclassified Nonomuraea TaxID=2593643 RepID=UPI0033E14BBF